METNEIRTCICCGTYQNYRKKRHDLSKKHIEFMNTSSISL